MALPETHSPTPPALDALVDAVAEGIAAASGSGRPEAVLREHVQPALTRILGELGVRSQGRDEVTLAVPAETDADEVDAPLDSAGRADALYNRFVIEFEPPGSLRASSIHSATAHAVDQVKQYLRGVADDTGLPLERLAGCAFDGSWIVYVQGDSEGFRVERPQPVDRDSLGRFVRTLESLASGRGLTADNLNEDFGRDSAAAKTFLAATTDVFTSGAVSERGQAMFEQWLQDVGNSSGPFAAADAEDWGALCNDLDLPSDRAAAPHVLFCVQTYFALVAKLVAAIILEGALDVRILEQLRAAGTVVQGFTNFESGTLTSSLPATNVIEPGVFSWYLTEPAAEIDAALSQILQVADEYSAEIVEVAPLAARDLLKDLYQRLVPRTIRHRLGEFYTPDWLAARVIDDVLADQGGSLRLGQRVLDPAAGSGTFLVEIISRLIRDHRRVPRHDLLQAIVASVVGFDLSPLAVQAAKVNYLLAVAPLLRSSGDKVALPVYLADSVSPPRRGDLFEDDVYVVATSEGDWRIPTALATREGLTRMGHVIRSALSAGDSIDKFERDAATALPTILQTRARLDQVRGIYEKMSELHAAERDGVWWDLISNVFAPTIQEPFDFVMGNPPWVSWETLPEAYRLANAEQWDLYELRPTALPGRRQVSGNVRLDLSMLFVAHSINAYLRAGGRLGFVITSTVFRSELAGRGFRCRRIPDGVYRFDLIEDLSPLRIFEGAVNMTSILVASRSRPRSGPLAARSWSPAPAGTIATDLALDAVLDRVHIDEIAAEPVDRHDVASPLLFLTREALTASRPVRRPSPYLEDVREGINTRGANGILFVEILEDRGSTVVIRNDPARGRNREVPSLTGEVEAKAVRLLVRGEDVTSAGATATLGVLFFHDGQHLSKPLPDALARQRFPKAVAFLEPVRGLLEGRRPFRNFRPAGPDWLGLYSVTSAAIAQHKVVIREIASTLIAAHLDGARLIPDHKLHVIRCSSASEAVALTSALQTPSVRALIHGFALPTSVTGSLLRYVGVKPLENGVSPHSKEGLAAALGVTLAQLQALDDAISRVRSPTAPQTPS